MKHTLTTPIFQPVSIRNLKITTAIRLHPEFIAKPRVFARQHGVDLADDIHPETDFKKDPDDPNGDERIERVKWNIHLVRHGAIRLFVDRDQDEYWIRSIDLNPSMLLYEAERHLLAEGDLPLALSILKTQIAPLLADPIDAQHIVPGLVPDENAVAFWSTVDTEALFPGIQIPCLHGLSHPGTGPADGATKKRIQFGDKKDDCVIRIKAAKWEADGPDVEGIRVRLILKGRTLTGEFMQSGKTAKVNNTMRLVAFSESSLARDYQTVMGLMQGAYLPVPPEWRDVSEGKRVTTAKVIAIVSQLSSKSLEEIRAIDEEERHPSDSTRKRLNKDLPVETGRLAPVPVATLFQPSAYVSSSSGSPALASDIDPMIAEAYGTR